MAESNEHNSQPAVAQTPAPSAREQLLEQANQLGLDVSADIDGDELTQAIRMRLRLIESLPVKVLLEIAAWARRPIDDPNDKVGLARQISRIQYTRFPGLSDEGLRALAILRGCQVEPDDDRDRLRRKLKAQESFFQKFRRKRRALFGKWIAKVFGDAPPGHRQLPEAQRSLSLKERIEHEGVVTGLKERLRGAADDYVREKLDEIEARIDRKLDEIDQRLAEWRNREIANRLKIIRITLLASIAVALLSLAYTYIKSRFPGWLP